MNHAEQAFLKPPVAESPKKSLKDATLEDLSIEKQAAVAGELTDKQKDDLMAKAAKNNETARITDLSSREKDNIVRKLAEQSRAGLYAEANSGDVVDRDFDSLSDEEKLAQFDMASAVFKETVAPKSFEAQQAGDVEVLKQADRVQEILNLDPEKLKVARDTIRTYREKITLTEAQARKSFERIQQLQAQYAKAVESNSPDAGKIDAQLSAEIANNEMLDAAVKRHEKFVATAEVAFEKAFNIPSGSTTKEKE